MALNDVLLQLPTFSWRGIECPITSRQANFSQSHAPQTFSYRDNAVIESLGAQNFQFSYTIPFRQDIAKGPYKNLFVDVFPKFLAACRKRSPGTLNDPVLGEFRAKCVSMSTSLDVNKRDGVDVDVQFIQAPAIDEVDALPAKIEGITDLDDMAGVLDANVDRADFTQSEIEGTTGEIQTSNRQEEPPEAYQDLLGQLDGFGRQIERFGNKIDAGLSNVAFKLEKMEETISVLQNPKNWPLQRSSRRLRGAIANVALTVAYPGKKVLRHLVPFDISVSSLASNLGMDTGAFLALNPTVAINPMVPAGTEVSYLGGESVFE